LLSLIPVDFAHPWGLASSRFSFGAKHKNQSPSYKLSFTAG